MTTQPHQRRAADPAHYNLSMRVPPDPKFARTVRSAIESFAKLHRVSPFDIEPLLCAVSEAMANAIEHAASDQDLEVEANIDSEQILASVTDRGRGLPAIPNAPAQLPLALTERGRGIPIMQRLTDIFEVNSVPGKGTTVRLGRFRTGRREEQKATS